MKKTLFNVLLIAFAAVIYRMAVATPDEPVELMVCLSVVLIIGMVKVTR